MVIFWWVELHFCLRASNEKNDGAHFRYTFTPAGTPGPFFFTPLLTGRGGGGRWGEGGVDPSTSAPPDRRIDTSVQSKRGPSGTIRFNQAKARAEVKQRRVDEFLTDDVGS